MTESAGAQYNPFDREIVLQAISIWRSDERASRLSIPDLYKVILKANPTWRPKDLEIQDLTTGIAKVNVGGKTSNQKDTEPQQNDPESFPPFTSKRLLECLEAVSLAPNQLETPTYADKIHSVYPIPGLVMPTASAASWIDIRPFDHDPAHKGKGVFAKIDIPANKTVWTESPLFRVPHVSKVRQMRAGAACAYCGDLLRRTGSVVASVSCSLCDARFCSAKCRNADLAVHAATWHTRAKGSKTSQIKPSAWAAYEEYCFSGATTKGIAPSGAIANSGQEEEKNGSNQWMSGYAVGLVLLKMIVEFQKSKEKGGLLKQQFEAMATISQDVRQAIADKTYEKSENKTGSLFASEQAELVWEKGYELLKKAVSKAVTFVDASSTAPNTPSSFPLSYQWYLNAIGTWNLNNIGGCIFLVQSNLNHSCEPNIRIDFPSRAPSSSLLSSAASSSTSYLLNPISVVAQSEISKDTELTISYVNPTWSYETRQNALKTNWGFKCLCPKCVKEAKEWEVTVDQDGNIL